MKEIKTSPLDFLLDSAFDERLLEERNKEIQGLKLQLSSIAFKNSQEESYSLPGSAISLPAISQNGSVKEIQQRIDLDNVLAIFSHLQFPNLAIPVESNLSQFLATLKGALERTGSA